jgi:hypothetical protein
MIAHLHGMDNKVKLEWGWSCGCSEDSLLLEIDWNRNGRFSGGVFSREDAYKLLKLLQTGLQQTNGGAKPKLPKR